MRKLNLDEQQVLASYAKHKSAQRVADEFGCSYQSIYRILHKHGIRRQKSKKHVKHLLPCGSKKCCPLAVVLLRRCLGMKPSAIAATLGYTPNAVNSIISRRCPETIVRKHKEDFDIEQMVHEYRDLGMTSYELGEKYGLLPSTVRKWMRQEGVCKGKDNGISQTRSHEAAVERFVDSYPESLSRCNTWRDRAYVRRKNRILSRPHDKGCDGIKWWDIAKRNGGDLTCWICGGECVPGSRGDDAPSVDHLVPISNGGSDTFDNVRIAHRGCNRDRGNRVQLTLDYLIYKEAHHAQEQAARN